MCLNLQWYPKYGREKTLSCLELSTWNKIIFLYCFVSSAEKYKRKHFSLVILALCDILLRIVLHPHRQSKSCVFCMHAHLLAHEAPTVINNCMVLIVLWKCTLWFLSMRYGFAKARIPKKCANMTNLWLKDFYTCLRIHFPSLSDSTSSPNLFLSQRVDGNITGLQ